MGLIAMSERDLQRIEILSKVIAGRMSKVIAGACSGLKHMTGAPAADADPDEWCGVYAFAPARAAAESQGKIRLHEHAGAPGRS
ncbi:hypothetical protein ACVIDN_006320 [Rhizobium brockwellii]